MWQNREPRVPTYPGTNWRLDPEISGGGYFHDLAPHQLDLMLYFFGEPVHYTGYSLNQANMSPADDNVSGTIVFKSGIVVNGNWAFNVAESEMIDTCEVVGTKGKITFPFFGTWVSVKTDSGEETINFTHPEHIQQPMIEKIVAFFKDEGPNPCTINEAVVLMKIIDSFTIK
jgi:predicted dehydrogenase